MQNTAAKKRSRQEDVDSDYLFGNFLRFTGFRSMDETNLNRRVGSWPQFRNSAATEHPFFWPG